MHLDELTLNEWLDEALPARERRDADAHMAGCPECAARLAELRAVFAKLEALPEMPLARDLTPGVLARLPTPPKPAFGRGWRWALGLQAALAVGVLLITAPALDPAPVAAVAADLQAGWAQLLAGWWTGLGAQAQADLDAVAAAGGQLILNARAVAAPLGQWPAAVWSAGLATLGLMWLAGNGLALRRLSLPISQTRSR